MHDTADIGPDHHHIAEQISQMAYRRPPRDMTATVMRRIASASRTKMSWWQRLTTWLLTPRPVRLAPWVPLAGAAGMAVMLVFFAGVTQRMGQEPGLARNAPVPSLQAPNAGEAGQAGLEAGLEAEGIAPPVGASMASTDGANREAIQVVFSIQVEDAREVALIGSFNNWQGAEYRLRPGEGQGVWSISVPLEQGRHEYAFLLNGSRIMPDPGALLYKDDGFGNLNSVIVVEDNDQNHAYQS